MGAIFTQPPQPQDSRQFWRRLIGSLSFVVRLQAKSQPVKAVMVKGEAEF
jgi:hypothetical protein